MDPAGTAKDIYSRALVIDANCLPPLEDDNLPISQAVLDLIRGSGVNVMKSSLGGINGGFADVVEQIAYAQRLFEVHPAYFLQVRRPEDIRRAKNEGKLGIILSFESVEMLEGKIERLDLFRRFGVLVMQLSYNRKSPFAAGVLEPNGGGLTSAGVKAVARMNALGITIDLSHANAQTTTEVLQASAKPVVMTHTGCAAIHPHPRNKTDEQLRALAQQGGVVGIYTLPYLVASPKQPNVQDFMAHMSRALNVAGEDHVGVGTDSLLNAFDTSEKGLATFKKNRDERQKAGLAAPEEDRPLYVEGMNMPRRIEVVADALLTRGYPTRVVEKVLGRNFERVFSATWLE